MVFARIAHGMLVAGAATTVGLKRLCWACIAHIGIFNTREAPRGTRCTRIVANKCARAADAAGARRCAATTSERATFTNPAIVAAALPRRVLECRRRAWRAARRAARRERARGTWRACCLAVTWLKLTSCACDTVRSVRRADASVSHLTCRARDTRCLASPGLVLAVRAAFA